MKLPKFNIGIASNALNKLSRGFLDFVQISLNPQKEKPYL